jgi:hypothetical protein
MYMIHVHEYMEDSEQVPECRVPSLTETDRIQATLPLGSDAIETKLLPTATMYPRIGSHSNDTRLWPYALCSFPDSGFGLYQRPTDGPFISGSPEA